MLVQEILSVILRTVLIIALQGWQSDDVVFDLFDKSSDWWGLTILIGVLSVFASFMYLYILKGGNGIDFIAYETPITLILAFLVAPLFIKGQEWTKEKLIGVGLIGTGIYFFNK